MKKVDARGLACPKPVILTKEAISDLSINSLEVIVDNEAALENVKRFLSNFGFEVKKVENLKGDFTIIAERKETEKNMESFDINEYPCPLPNSSTQGKNIFIKSQFLGLGDDELGALLMKAFIYTLNEVDNIPKTLLFMNSGVKLCIENAITLENIQKLEKSGVEVLVCGTCLDFYKITDKLKVGKISNMYDIAGHLTDNSQVLSV